MGYTYFRSITIDHTQAQATGATYMRLLFTGGSFAATVANGGRLTNPNGYDLVFALDNADASPIVFELVPGTYNAATGAGEWWVRIPVPSISVDSVLYVIYQNAAITTYQGSALTWNGVSTTDYTGVIHFDTASAPDSTSNGNDLNVSVGVPAYAAGRWNGFAFSGNGSSALARHNVGFPSNPYGGNFSFSCWFKFASTAATDNIPMGIGSNGGINPNVRCDLDVFPPSTTINIETFSGASHEAYTPDTAWHYAVITSASGAAASASKLYIDGVLQTLTGGSGSGYNIPTSNYNMIVSGLPGTGGQGYITGLVDEFRVSTLLWDAGLIAMEWANQKDSSTFYALGAEMRIGVFATLVIDDGPGLTDRTNYLLFGDNMALNFSLQVKTRGTATITITVPAGDTYTPTTGAILYLSDLNAPVCVFAGTIDSWQITYQSNEGLRYIALTCTDLMQTLDTICIPPRAYFSTTAGAIITDIYNTVLAPTIPFALGTISAGVTVPALLLTWDKVSDVINNLAAASQFAWGIDYSAAVGGSATPLLYFTTPGAVGSPLTLLTTDILWETAQYTETRANFINRQIVRISYNAFTSLTDYNITPNGILTAFNLRYPAYQVQSAGLTTSTQSAQTGTFTGVPSNNDTVTLAGRTYTWKTVLDNTQKDQIFIGASAGACAINLADAINAEPSTAGLNFSFPTWYHQTLAASSSSSTVTVSVMISGTAGNGTALSESTANFTWAGGSTAGGTDGITTALTVGVLGAGSTADLYYTSGSAALTAAVPPATGVFLVVAYQRYGADCIVVENSASVAARSAAEGGTGHYEVVTSDTSETNPDTALLAAQAIIANYCVFPDILQFQTDKPGWVLGQELTTALTAMGTLSTLVTGTWLIHQVDGNLVIPDDPRLQYLGFRYTVYIVNTSTVATYVQFFQQLAAPASTTPGASNPNSGGGAAASGPQFITDVLTANTIIPANPLNSNNVQLTVTAIQDATGGWTVTFTSDFVVAAGDIVNPAANSTTQWVFLGDGTHWVEQSYKQL